MRFKSWMFGAALLTALTPLALPAAEAGRTFWSLGDFTWVKRVPAEAGAAPNAQPAQVSADEIRTLLASVRAKVDGKVVPLFSSNELRDLTEALSDALALSQPGEDLIMVSSSRRDRLFARQEAATARLFVHGGALNLLVHDARLSFMDRYLDENVTPTFVFGSRITPSAAQLQSSRGTGLRPDWLVLPLAPAASAASVLGAAPVQVAAPTPAASAAGEAAYEAKAERLRTLKRLRDENLISEAEYQEKREAILKSL